METNQRVALFVLTFIMLSAFNILVWQPINKHHYGKPKEYTFNFNITYTVISILILLMIAFI